MGIYHLVLQQRDFSLITDFKPEENCTIDEPKCCGNNFLCNTQKEFNFLNSSWNDKKMCDHLVSKFLQYGESCNELFSEWTAFISHEHIWIYPIVTAKKLSGYLNCKTRILICDTHNITQLLILYTPWPSVKQK